MENRNVTVLYGSETGNAQDVAEQIWRNATRYYLSSQLWCMSEFELADLLRESCVVFVCSTTGQGEEPSNMKKMWRQLLRKHLTSDCLRHLRFAVFGLGDSSYANYNYAAKKLYKRLQQLGAQPLVELGLGDDQHDLGYLGAADLWIHQFWTALLNIYPLPNGREPLPIVELKPRWSVSIVNNATPYCGFSIYQDTLRPSYTELRVLENLRTTAPDHFQDVRLIRLGGNMIENHMPGDVIAIRPKNLQSQVDAFKALLVENGVDLFDDCLIRLQQNNSKVTLPKVFQGDGDQLRGWTFDQLCSEYFDLMAIPRRYTFEVLARITDCPLEREKCEEFCQADGQQELYSYCDRPKRNIVETLHDFPHATKHLTLDLLFEIIPEIRPREFSIANSSVWCPDEVHILVAVVKYRTNLVAPRLGLCSNFLAGLEPNNRLLGCTKRGTFTFPIHQPLANVIMIAPGTGLAPFRNFIFHRSATGTATTENTMLIFGCRNEQKDFHCKDELIQLQQSGQLNLVTAFSRHQEYKIYVQHKIEEHATTVWNMLKDGNGYIYVAGNSKFMPQQVREAFVNVCESSGNLSIDEAETFIKHMEKAKRYQVECWS